MNRLTISSKNAPNFIGCWQLANDDLCNDMVQFFEDNPQLQGPGATGSGVKPSQKKSTDIAINPNDLTSPNYRVFEDYFMHLRECYTDYKAQWPFLNTFLDRVHLGPFNLQRYLPGDHFSNLHSERTHLSKIHRVFAFMTYLNDVEEGGTTDFHHYGIKIKPEKARH